MRSVVFGRSDGDDDEGAQAAMEEWRRRMPPDNEVVGTVAVDTVVTRNEDVAFTLRSLRVMSNGVLLDFVVQHRVDDDPAVGGHPRFPFGGGVLVTGTVDSVSGTTMTLKETNGSTVTVNLASTTTYHAQAAATAADVTTGKQVQVEVQIAGGFGGQGVPGASPGADASPVPGASAPTRTITARDVTLVTP